MQNAGLDITDVMFTAITSVREHAHEKIKFSSVPLVVNVTEELVISGTLFMMMSQPQDEEW